MQHTRIHPQPELVPQEFRSLISENPIFDSSSSPLATVWFIDSGKGYFLKSSQQHALQHEAVMTKYCAEYGFSAQVLEYISDERDWLLTEKIPGDDCVAEQYLSEPERLAETMGMILAQLHQFRFENCPIGNVGSTMLAKAEYGYRHGVYDATLLSGDWSFSSAQQAWDTIERYGSLLNDNVVIHGDYCLPNIILDNWHFSGCIDFDNAGIGDRHIDLFWGAWTLRFNLHTDAYRDRFFDAYGRSSVDPRLIRLVAACSTMTH